MNKVKAYISDAAGQFRQQNLGFVSDERAEMRLIKIYPEETRQSILGFGGAFTESAAVTFAAMSPVNRKKAIQAYFGPSGNRYNLCRTHIQSCDFSLGNYAYVEDEKDRELNSFSLERDHRHLIPMIREALELEPNLELLASPWSPPPFMKSNGEMNHGGVLKREYYQMWADMMVRYVTEYRRLGLPVGRITVQNEPKAVQTWDSCLYTGEEEGVFAVDYLRRGLDKQGLQQIKIAVWDHNKDCIMERARETFAVPGARESIAGIAFHWYTGDHFEALAAVREKYPDQELIFTEGCVEYSRFRHQNEVKKAEVYLHDLIGNLNHGANGCIDWNLILDKQGGPNHVGNFCDAPMMYDQETDTLDVHLSYYYIGHLSRFISRGAKRMLVSRYTDQLDAFGAVNPDGSRVLVLMNKSDGQEDFQVGEGSAVCSLSLTPHSAATLCW
jgi:glucosylceramidase